MSFTLLDDYDDCWRPDDQVSAEVRRIFARNTTVSRSIVPVGKRWVISMAKLWDYDVADKGGPGDHWTMALMFSGTHKGLPIAHLAVLDSPMVLLTELALMLQKVKNAKWDEERMSWYLS